MADELYLLTVHGNHSGQHNEVGLYFHGSNLESGEVYDNAADLIASWMNDPMAYWVDLMPASYEVERISARRITPDGGITVTQEFQDGTWPGSISGGAASNQLCPVVRLIPPMPTKSAGRFFLPAIAESDINANIVQSGWEGRLEDFMEKILTNFGITSIQWVSAIYSRQLDSYVDTVNYDTSGTVGFQKRRARPH